MGNTEVYLIRHGLPKYTYDPDGHKLMYDRNVSLSEEGRQHVNDLSEQNILIDVLYTSPYTRARETAEILADKFGLTTIIEDEAFQDITPINSVGKLLDDVVSGRIEPHPEDETLEHAFDRVLKGFSRVLEKEHGKKIGIVSHGHPIRFIVWRYVEGQESLSKPMSELISNNYPLQAEAWVLVFDTNNKLVSSHLITRKDNEIPGKGKW